MSISDADWEYLQRLSREAATEGKPRELRTPSGQIRQALKDRRRIRHDVPGKAAALLLTAEAGAMKAMKPREVVENVKAVAQELAKMRDDA